MTLVFILSTYDEYGAEDVQVTLDRSLLCKMITKYFRFGSGEEQRKLMDILDGDDNNIIGKHNLSHGWGGIQLHVVELTESSAVEDIVPEYVPSHEEIEEDIRIKEEERNNRLAETERKIWEFYNKTPDPALAGLVYDPNTCQWVKPPI